MLSLALFLASCFRAPPDVAPSATLAPAAAGEGARTQGPFAVVFAGPRGVIADRNEPAITVLFNRSMRTLEAPDDVGLPALRVETHEGRAAAGSVRWLGTHGLLFLPDGPLPGATAFTVTVPAGVRSLKGDSTTQPYRFEMSTAALAVASSTPSPGATDVRPGDAFTLVFNQNVEPDAVAASTTLTVGAKAAPFHVSHPKLPPPKESREHVVVLAPDAPLALDSAVTLTVRAGLRGAEGPLPTAQPHVVHARTFGPLRLADVRCPKVNLGRCQAHRDIAVVLSNAVEPAELRAHMRTSIPRASVLASPHPARAKKAPLSSTTQYLGVDPREGQRYRVTLTSGMRDVFGQRLAKDLSFDVDVEAAFAQGPPPAARSKSTSQAKDPAPADIVTPRRPVLDYRAEFGIRGNILEAGARGAASALRLPIGVVNLPTYGLAAAALAQQDALRWLAKGDPSEGPGGVPFRWDWISPGAAENIRSVREVDLNALLAVTSGARVALVALGIPGSSPMPARTEFLDVTDLGLTAKMSRYGSLVWVTRLSTGEPVSGATVAARNGSRELFSTTTDAAGLAAIPASMYRPVSDHGAIDGATWLFAQKDDDWVYQHIERSLANVHAARDVDLAQTGEWQGFAFTDRGVYRPGDTIKVAAILRRSDAALTRVPETTDARIDVKDSRGENVFSGHVKTDAFGELALDIPIPRTTHLGAAAITIRAGRGPGDEFGTTVTLAAFKSSEFRVDVGPAKAEYIRGETAEFAVQGDYLYGAPMGGASLHNAASRTRTDFAPPGSAGFVTTDDVFAAEYPDESPRSASLEVDDGELDVQGHAARSIALDMPGQRGPEVVVFEAEVADATRQTVSQRASVLVHPAPFYVGLEVPSVRFASVGAPIKAGVVALSLTGVRTPGVHVRVELIARTWTAAAVDEAADVPQRGTKVVDTVVGSCDAVTTDALAACAIRMPSAGYFVLRAASAGPVVHASTPLWGIEDRTDAPPSLAWSDNGARGLAIDSDKESYAGGETAKILVRSPFKEADALVTIERAGVLWRNVVHVRGPMPVLSVPIESRFYPNVFVGVHLVRGRVAPRPAAGEADLGAPDFRTAYKELAIDSDTHRLRVKVSPAKEQYHPGESVDTDVTVTDREGHGVRGAVTFYAVDEGALMLTGYTTPDPLPAFAARKHLATFGLDNREHLAHFLPLVDGERVPILTYEYERRDGDGSAAADKGDDGGGGSDGAALRADFRTTAYFEPSRVTSEEGKAHFQFKLPDNLTRFRLMAVVASAADRFGFGESAIAASRKLMARPATPRVVRVGDAFQASVVVSSKDIGPANVAVTLDAKGVTLQGPTSKSVLVPKGGQVEVRFPVRATQPGSADFVFSVAGGGLTDRVLVHRVVDLPVDVRTAAIYGQASGDFAVAIGDLSHVRTDLGELDVRLATSALAGIDAAFDQLFEYPYGCTEQITSRTLPLLALEDMARAFHVRVPAKSHDAVDEGIGAIVRRQHGSGGFGYWEDDPEVPWLSAYAMWVLEAASKKGYYVPAAVLDRGIEYLRAALGNGGDAEGASPPDEAQAAGSDPSDEPGAPDKPPAVQDETDRAFIADVLAVVGSPDPAYLDRAYEARKAAPLAAQALLLHAMATSHMRVLERQTLAREIEQRLRVGANEAVAADAGGDGGLDSVGRTTALALRALLADNPQHPLGARLARGLLGLRRDGAWRSTQENLWALTALDDYRRAQEATPAEVEVHAYLGDDPIGGFSFHAGRSDADPILLPMQRVAVNPSGKLAFALKGQGSVFYSASLKYASTDLPTRPDDHGFFVQRLLHTVRPEELAAKNLPLPKITSDRAAAGDLVLVDLLVESAEPRDHIVIDDPLAGGLEAVSFELETSSKLEAVADVGTERVSRHRGLGGYGFAFAIPDQVHREVHDDRVLTFARHLDPGMYHFRYLARATTLGHFVTPPAEIHCMYAPETSGRTAATTFDVLEGAGRVAAR